VVCCIADEALNEEVLISRADEMLYKAKENGRNGYTITTNVSDATAKHVEEVGGLMTVFKSETFIY